MRRLEINEDLFDRFKHGGKIRIGALILLCLIMGALTIQTHHRIKEVHEKIDKTSHTKKGMILDGFTISKVDRYWCRNSYSSWLDAL